MYTTYHLTSAQEVNIELLEAIKATFKSKPIRIIVEDAENDFELTTEMKAILDQRVEEGEADYLTDEESLQRLRKKYDL